MDVYKSLRDEAFEANMEIPRRNLAVYTWGNASAFDPARGVFAIKPSGVDYPALNPASLVIVDLEGTVVDGTFKPSSDTKTHAALYRGFSAVCGITHTHSRYATAWAQAQKPVPIYGTTHADHSATEIPCTAILDPRTVSEDYEQGTGNLIIETFKKKNLGPLEVPMVLVAGHGPFTWGKNAAQAVYHSVVLEEVCTIAFLTLSLNPLAQPLPQHIQIKHWSRKHGTDAYYGQS
ncbi:L-ribulose-5-phosphate 4-epimerase [Pillotina sp. SPG140]|jgi:L-ribulose-5-phosphate 4-epimerase